MDLKDLSGVANDRFNETHTFTPKHPATGAEMGFKVEIRSMRSDEMLRLVDKYSREAQLKAAKEQRTQKVEVETLDKAIARDVDTAATLVVSFHGLKDGERDIGDDAEAVKAVLKQHSWLRKQILDEAADEQNFFKA